MVRTWRAFLELLWPQQRVPIAKTTQTSVRFFNGIQYLSPYQDHIVQALIKRTKYHADRTAAAQLATYLDSYLSGLEVAYSIVPMPISYQRWRERGYNHIELICHHSLYKDQVRTDILTKTRHTKQQTQVTRNERIWQQRNTFSCSPARCRTLPHTVILLDDVVTTGATMTAAASTLQPHLPPGTKLLRLAIAH